MDAILSPVTYAHFIAGNLDEHDWTALVTAGRLCGNEPLADRLQQQGTALIPMLAALAIHLSVPSVIATRGRLRIVDQLWAEAC